MIFDRFASTGRLLPNGTFMSVPRIDVSAGSRFWILIELPDDMSSVNLIKVRNLGEPDPRFGALPIAPEWYSQHLACQNSVAELGGLRPCLGDWLQEPSD